MTPNDQIKMTNDEIKKALKCCISSLCVECPFKAINCDEKVPMAYALNLIYQYEVNIERLQEHIKEGIDLAKEIPEMLTLAKAEAIKEFAERLIDLTQQYVKEGNINAFDIKDLLKEMGGNK